MIKKVSAVAVAGMIMFTMSACDQRNSCIEQGSFLGTKVADAKPSSSSGVGGSKSSASPSSKSSSSGSFKGSGKSGVKSSSKTKKAPKIKAADEEDIQGAGQYGNARGSEDCD